MGETDLGALVERDKQYAIFVLDEQGRVVALSSRAQKMTGARPGAQLSLRDPDQERRQREALRESEELFRLLVQSVTDYAIIMLDPRGRVSSWNPGAERIAGWSEAEILGQHLSVFYPPEDRATKPARELEQAARGRFEDEGWRVRRDGSRFWANVVVTPLRDARGALRGFAKVTRDFSERRAAEATARQLSAERATRAVMGEAERQLRASEDRYRRQSEQLSVILESVADGITVQDSGGQLLFANDAAARICGFASSAEMVHTPTAEILERFDLRDEHGQPFPPGLLPGNLVLAGREAQPTILGVVEKATGRRFWATCNAAAVRDEAGRTLLAVNVFHDITAQHRQDLTARFLAEASAMLASGLDGTATLERVAHMSVPSLADWSAVDLLEDGRLSRVAVAHADPAMVALMRDLHQRFPPPPDAPNGPQAVARTGRAELYPEITDAMLAARARDPEPLRVVRALGLRSGICVPLLAGGRTIGALTLASSSSQRRYDAADLALAEELGRRAGMAVDNARLYREAREAVDAREEFLSIAGHELKTPLAALLLQVGGVERMLERGEVVDRGQLVERVRKVTGYCARLARLIEELLDVSRITSGRLRIERQEVDLHGLVAEVVERQGDALAAAKCQTRIHGDPLMGSWDRLRIDQVVTNLVSNAAKYGRGQPIDLTVARRDGHAVLTVADHGMGVSQEDRERIFGRFERAVSLRSFGGLGLGLWISRQIVEAHGGSIRVESDRGEGATFVVELPA